MSALRRYWLARRRSRLGSDVRTTSLSVTIAVLLAGGPVAAQQGSVQVVAASVVSTGSPSRTGLTQNFQPDFGVSWLQPTRNWGTVNLDAHAVRGTNDPRLGRALFAIRDLKRGGFAWNLSGGDSAYTPFLTDYGFNNLFAPQVTFRGASVGAVNAATSFSVTAGRVTVLRDLFAANPEVLGQTLFVARGSHKPTSRVEFVAHASGIRTRDVKEFTSTIQSGDDAGAGVRLNVTKSLQLIADGGLTSFRRKGAAKPEQKVSFLIGTRWTGKQGWFQVDAHRFSPGNFSVVNNPFMDREGAFAGGEYNVSSRVRLFGGWDVFRNNLEPTATATVTPSGTLSRAFGGARVRVNSHLFVGTRLEDGARTWKPSQYTVGYESDTGAKAVDWQITFKRWFAVGRYEQRSNVDAGGGATSTSHKQHDFSGQFFYNVTSSTRLFSTLFVTERRGPLGDGQSFWQASAGTNFQVLTRNLFGRAELIVGRNRELSNDFLQPRTAFGGGLSAHIRNHVSLSLDVFVDRSPVHLLNGSPWMSRTIARVVYTLPTGSPASAPLSVARAPKGGSETIDGVVFVDWNGNGLQEPDEETVRGVRVELDRSLGATSDEHGRFRFERLAGGPHVVAIDLGTIPADFDAPASRLFDLDLRRGAFSKVVFGVLPLGDIEGLVVRDTNGSGTIDENDAPVDDAVLTLDQGARTEVTRKGRFRFSGATIGKHKVEVLLESLPEGLTLAGERQVEVEVSRAQRTAAAQFLIKLEARPEIRKVFPPKKVETGTLDVVEKSVGGSAPSSKVAAKAGASEIESKGSGAKVRGKGGSAKVKSTDSTAKTRTKSLRKSRTKSTSARVKSRNGRSTTVKSRPKTNRSSAASSKRQTPRKAQPRSRKPRT